MTKAIFNIYKMGFNYLPESEALTNRILSKMNNNRLSTYSSEGIEGWGQFNPRKPISPSSRYYKVIK